MVAPGIEALARGGRRMLRRMWGQRERETGVGELYLLQAKRIRENPLFLACKENDVGGIKKLLTSGTTDVFQRGALGETVLHVAVLHHNLESVVALLDAVPDLVNEPAASDVYRGETALHIAVLNQDTQIVREMLDRGADVRTPRVTGSYFKRSPENLAYFGEHVLSFAACCGNEEIIQLLIDGGADIAAVDSLGNTVLHILALQPNKTIACQMYDLIEGLEGTETVVRAGTVPNHDGLTPLKLAAIEGNLMFDHLMKKQRLVCWELGPISHCLYNLQEIDSWQEDRSVLELVLSSKKTEALSILDLSPLVQLISLKWAGYGRFYFRLLTLFYLLYIIVFTLCCVFRPLKARVGNVTDSRDTTIYVQRTLQEAYGSSSDHVRLVGELISVLGAMVTLLLEIPDIMRFGVRQYFGKTALGGPFHVIIISHAGLVLLILVLRLTDTPGEVVAMSLALVLGWCNVMFFARGFAMLGPFTITIQKMIFGDLIRFCWLMFLVLLGFTAAFHLTFQTLEPDLWPHFRDFSTCLFTMFQLFLGLLDIPINYEKLTPAIIKVLYVAYMVLAFLLMVNLLIAVMGDTHWRVADKRDQLWRAQVVASIILIERHLPRGLCPRVGIDGERVGLAGTWYLRVQERTDMGSQKLHRYAQHFRAGHSFPTANPPGSGWEIVRQSATETGGARRSAQVFHV
ncbi:transient receptor potential cation channel subfamily V member 6-like isoform X2 [Narcine bancroftii]|uniref:transient receptor potential cation channel subfamily V member 6-like isoform X2 n=1 Tax=Narcine bancroftii TaxID=1343680 RepID=UPI0038319B0E